MKTKTKKWIRPTLFTLGGAAIGFLYYRFVGCASGTCAIASNPVISTLYMGAVGLLLSGMFRKECKDSCNTR